MAITTRHMVAGRIQLLAELASRPNRPAPDANTYRWATWRAICDLCTSHPGYRYDDPRKFLLLKLADFAFTQMGKHSHTYWRNQAKLAKGVGRDLANDA